MLHLKSLALGAAAASILVSAFAVSAQEKAPPPGEEKGLYGPDGLSHFQCYRIAPGPIGHPPVGITTTDQFGKQDLKIGNPIQICNPTLKIHKGKTFAAVNPKAHLICYQILTPEAKPRAVDTRNQFYNRKYQTGPRTVFCAPSYKTLIGEKEFPLNGN